MMNWLTGFHAVEEALTAGRPLDRIVIASGRHGERIEAIVRLAKSRGVPVRFEATLADRQTLTISVPRDTGESPLLIEFSRSGDRLVVDRELSAPPS